MATFLIILGCIFLLALYSELSTRSESRRDAERCTMLLAEIERKYEEFLSRRVEKSNVASGDVQRLADEAMLILKPEIDGLIQVARASNVGSVNIRLQSFYFTSAISTTESLFPLRKRQKMLNERDERSFVSSFRDSIVSNLITRRIDNNPARPALDQ